VVAKSFSLAHATQAGIAQLVEQRTENPRVTSSSLVPGILLPPTSLDGRNSVLLHGAVLGGHFNFDIYTQFLAKNIENSR
jgi:hypothetical protein